MRTWFFSHYEDPAVNTPYESREGGYIYIWGGPYEASDELMDEFVGLVPEDVIRELVDEIEEKTPEWAGKPSAEDVDRHYYSAVLSNTDFHRTFLRSIKDIRSLLEVPVQNGLNQNLFRLLYANIVTTLEALLSDAFVTTVLSDQELIRKFIETHPDFARRTLKLNEIFNTINTIDDKVRQYLLELIWHRLSKVIPMYKDTLDIGSLKIWGTYFTL